MKLLYVTGNQEKIAIAHVALKSLANIEIIGMKIDCPELQSDDSRVIAKHSAKYASNYTQQSVIKTDSGLFIEELNGFPGPYSEYVERKLDAQDIINLMKGKSNRKAYYKEALVFCEYLGKPVVFEAFTYGVISDVVDGNQGSNFDRIFICDGDFKTMANFSLETRVRKYSHENWGNLSSYLKQAEAIINKCGSGIW